jgi:hypothetical protein
LLWDIEEEIEVLGWLLGFENIITLICVSYLLSIACFCLVNIIISARKARFAILDNNLYFKNVKRFLGLKTQNFFLQEIGSVGFPRHAFKYFHHRRI